MLMSTPIIERVSLTELKTFLLEQSLSSNFMMDTEERFKKYTTPEGMDIQNSYAGCYAEAKVWIQYFRLSNEFSLNINFFATIDGASINPEDFLRHVPTGIKVVEYVNSQKIRWVNDDTGNYVQVLPPTPVYKLPEGTEMIYPI